MHDVLIVRELFSLLNSRLQGFVRCLFDLGEFSSILIFGCKQRSLFGCKFPNLRFL